MSTHKHKWTGELGRWGDRVGDRGKRNLTASSGQIAVQRRHRTKGKGSHLEIVSTACSSAHNVRPRPRHATPMTDLWAALSVGYLQTRVASGSRDEHINRSKCQTKCQHRRRSKTSMALSIPSCDKQFNLWKSLKTKAECQAKLTKWTKWADSRSSSKQSSRKNSQLPGRGQGEGNKKGDQKCFHVGGTWILRLKCDNISLYTLLSWRWHTKTLQRTSWAYQSYGNQCFF